MTDAMTDARFIDVFVEGASDCEGCCLRFRAAGPIARVLRVRGAFGADAAAWFRVASRAEDGERVAARAALVEDSSAGLAMLVFGDARGLWLWREGAPESEGHAEPYLLLAPHGVELEGA
jgi:hypothetical protein